MSRYFNDWYFGCGQSVLDTCPEEFAHIPDFPEDYYIHPEGYVCKGDHVIQTYPVGERGYREIKVYRNGKVTRKYLHRALAETFIPNPDNLPVVRHLNDDGGDNRVENLAWGTVKDNLEDSKRNGGYVGFTEEAIEKSIAKKRKAVIATTPDGEELYFPSQRDACRELGVRPECVTWVVNGKLHQTGGYRFRRADHD